LRPGVHLHLHPAGDGRLVPTSASERELTIGRVKWLDPQVALSAVAIAQPWFMFLAFQVGMPSIVANSTARRRHSISSSVGLCQSTPAFLRTITEGFVMGVPSTARNRRGTGGLRPRDRARHGPGKLSNGLSHQPAKSSGSSRYGSAQSQFSPATMRLYGQQPSAEWSCSSGIRPNSRLGRRSAEGPVEVDASWATKSSCTANDHPRRGDSAFGDGRRRTLAESHHLGPVTRTLPTSGDASSSPGVAGRADCDGRGLVQPDASRPIAHELTRWIGSVTSWVWDSLATRC
jgi:hypothetical protein